MINTSQLRIEKAAIRMMERVKSGKALSLLTYIVGIELLLAIHDDETDGCMCLGIESLEVRMECIFRIGGVMLQ